MPKTFTDQTATVTGTPLNNSTLNNMLTTADIGVASGAAGLNGSSQLTATATAAALTINGTTTLAGHVANSGTTPTVAIASGASGRVASVAISGTDHSCGVNITSTGTPGAGDQATVTFATPYASTPRVQAAMQGGWASVFISAVSTSGFTIAYNTAPGAGLLAVVCTIEQ